jgi:hypothetical protein
MSNGVISSRGVTTKYKTPSNHIPYHDHPFWQEREVKYPKKRFPDADKPDEEKTTVASESVPKYDVLDFDFKRPHSAALSARHDTVRQSFSQERKKFCGLAT